MAPTDKERLLQQLVQLCPPFPNVGRMPSRSARSPQASLQTEIEALSVELGAFDAHVLDAWGKVWSSASLDRNADTGELARLVQLAEQRIGISIARGGRLDVDFADGVRRAYLRSYASCYVLLLRFPRAFDASHVRSVVARAVPRLETLTLLIPPDGGPGSSGNEGAATA